MARKSTETSLSEAPALVAILRGAAGATSADVYVEVAENVFVA